VRTDGALPGRRRLRVCPTSLVDEHAVVFRLREEVTMVGADILAEIRLRAEGLRTRVDWGEIGLVLTMALTVPIVLILWPVSLPEADGPALTTALAGAAVWGAP
jgi:hypothetical protein